MNNIVLIIFGMAAVTYGPRLAPFLLLKNKKIPPRLDAFLKCIPVAAIGALIVPGVFSATPEMPLAALGGILFALAMGWWRGGIIVPVLGSVVVTYVVLVWGI
ncbi:MAG: AzlD domain-containing protein [Pseudomonadota bacterium]